MIKTYRSKKVLKMQSTTTDRKTKLVKNPGLKPELGSDPSIGTLESQHCLPLYIEICM